jgi:hypothetical protein
MEIFNFRNLDVINGHIYSDKVNETTTFNKLEYPKLQISNITADWDITEFLYDKCIYVLIEEVKDADPKSTYHVISTQPFEYTVKYIFSADMRFDKDSNGDYSYHVFDPEYTSQQFRTTITTNQLRVKMFNNKGVDILKLYTNAL